MKFGRMFNQVPQYVRCSILVSISFALFGLDTGSIGPLTLMKQFEESFGRLSSTVHGLLVSTILITAATASFFAGHVANNVGRAKAIAIGTFVFAIGASIETASVRLAMFFVGRAIKGAGMGLFLSPVAVFITEISPSRTRGRLVSCPQLILATALCAGYFICYGSVRLQSSVAWRLPCMIQAIIGFSVTIYSYLLLPESPRWLTSQGRTRESQIVWEQLEIDAAEREKLEEGEDAPLPKRVRTSDILNVFSKKAWKQTSLGVFLMMMQQLSGIDGVLYYAPTLFRNAGLTSDSSSFLASGVSAILMLAATVPALAFADHRLWGRRVSTITGGVVQFVTMFTIGALYASGSVYGDHGAGRWIVIICIYIFAIGFNATWAVTFRIYVSEIQSPETRAGASSLALSANWVVNWVVAFTTPIFLARSPFGVYFLFGGAAFLTVIVSIFFMPETTGKTLEEIQASFHKNEVVNSSSVLANIHSDQENVGNKDGSA